MRLPSLIFILFNIYLIESAGRTESESSHGGLESEKSEIVPGGAEERSDDQEETVYEEYEYEDAGENSITVKNENPKGNSNGSTADSNEGFPNEVFLSLRNITADAATAFRSFTNRNDVVDLQASASDNLNVTANNTFGDAESAGINMRALRDAGHPPVVIEEGGGGAIHLPYKHTKIDTADLSDCALQGEWKPMGVAHGHLHVGGEQASGHQAEVLQSVGSYAVPNKIIPLWQQNQVSGAGQDFQDGGFGHKPSGLYAGGTGGGSYGSGFGYGGPGPVASGVAGGSHSGGFSGPGQFQKIKSAGMLSPPPVPPVIFGRKPGYWKLGKTKHKFFPGKGRRPGGYSGGGSYGFSGQVSHGAGSGFGSGHGHGSGGGYGGAGVVSGYAAHGGGGSGFGSGGGGVSSHGEGESAVVHHVIKGGAGGSSVSGYGGGGGGTGAGRAPVSVYGGGGSGGASVSVYGGGGSGGLYGGGGSGGASVSVYGGGGSGGATVSVYGGSGSGGAPVSVYGGGGSGGASVSVYGGDGSGGASVSGYGLGGGSGGASVSGYGLGGGGGASFSSHKGHVFEGGSGGGFSTSGGGSHGGHVFAGGNGGVLAISDESSSLGDLVEGVGGGAVAAHLIGGSGVSGGSDSGVGGEDEFSGGHGYAAGGQVTGGHIISGSGGGDGAVLVHSSGGGLSGGHLVSLSHGTAGGDSLLPEAGFLSTELNRPPGQYADSTFSSTHVSQGLRGGNSLPDVGFLSSHLSQDFAVHGQGVSDDSSSSSTFTCGKNHDHNTNYHTATFQVADHDHPSSVDVLRYGGDAAVLIQSGDASFHDEILPERKHYKTSHHPSDAEVSGSDNRNELTGQTAKLTAEQSEQDAGPTDAEPAKPDDGEEPERHSYYHEITKVTKIPATSVGSVQYTFSQYETKPQTFSAGNDAAEDEPEPEQPQIIRELEHLSNKFQLDVDNPQKLFEDPPSQELAYHYPFQDIGHQTEPAREEGHEGITEFPYQFYHNNANKLVQHPVVHKKPVIKYVPRPGKPQFHQKTTVNYLHPKAPVVLLRKPKPKQFLKKKQNYEVHEHSGERHRPVGEIFPPQKFPKQFHNPKPNFAVDRPKGGWRPDVQEYKYDFSHGKKVRKFKTKAKVVAPILVRRPVSPAPVIRVVEVSG